MGDDSEFAIGFLDLQLSRIRLDAKGIVVGGVDNHDGGCVNWEGRLAVVKVWYGFLGGVPRVIDVRLKGS